MDNCTFNRNATVIVHSKHTKSRELVSIAYHCVCNVLVGKVVTNALMEWSLNKTWVVVYRNYAQKGWFKMVLNVSLVQLIALHVIKMGRLYVTNVLLGMKQMPMMQVHAYKRVAGQDKCLIS